MITKTIIKEPKTQSMDSDVTGKVFFWENKIFRGINETQIDRIKHLFNCGLIAELEANYIIPKTWICTEYEIHGFELLLQHELIPINLRPNQWSTEMFIDATKLVLNINKILFKYGYSLQDAHAYNIMFYGTRPVYVDIGSFMPLDEGYITLNSFAQEYISYFHHYTKLIEANHIHLFRTLLNSYERGFHFSEYLYFKYGEKLLSNKFFKRYIGLKYEELYFKKTILKRFINKFKIRKPKDIIIKSPHERSDYRNPTKDFNLDYFIDSISKIKPKNINSFWGSYHSSIIDSPHFTQERFFILAEIINTLPISTAIEIGGNQGYFTKILLEKTKLENIICSDYDEDALNIMYQNFKIINTTKVSPMYLDFTLPYGDPKDEIDLYDRVKQELVIMLAVSHHLVLTQQIPIDFILQRLAKFTSKYVMIEFMPLGLYDPDHPHYSITPPVWYNEEWFTQAFEKHFELVKRIQTEVNRIAFIGKIKTN